MIDEFYEILERCKSNENVRSIVIEGKGSSFCAGDDLIDMGTKSKPNPEDKLLEYRQGYPKMIKQMRSVPKPIICKVQKYALGAGFEIVMASDIIIAESKAQFGLPFALRGMASGTYLLKKYAGYHLACE